ncbi:hypothetical protein KAFR_0J00350 [Kazachstania africana CBS 2517]|uniref:Brl1/Brr6 domain-containing protein n=1 Tax=Kazachstania africana (strain ATCC 22294 / BCRC 22015 / CBS 2517 / CECT 1963 / NBRC 1671 / NRRL Y-8276) TaxID=1071382 RepID=H2B0F3_KAZAF|nr:hypothetical protein KAFR_0J00350 [Kazachstania africana CBS 2517]CCF60103.1 hypothetical protein KAFR_0J00350 [Kazachstania africana CBS 2517]
MEVNFSNLSISDNKENEMDLNILGLSIQDGNPSKKYMNYLPVNPSPLRQNFNELASYDEMEIDTEDVVESNDVDVLFKDNLNIVHEETEELDELEVEINENEEIYDEKELSLPKKNVIKALLSPTQLGAAAAATAYKGGRELTPEELKNVLKERSKLQPIQVQINNNNYHFHGEIEPNRGVEESLPNPWSSQSLPSSKKIYNLISYSQFLMNSFSISIIFMFIVRTIKSDLNSTWYKNKLTLINESSFCSKQYILNNCQINGKLPALSDDCETWYNCMNRNNDLIFNNKSILMFNLFGNLINSFIEPIGIKTLVVLLLGVLIWFFTSNFLMGFLRAKYYYGDSTTSHIKSSQQQDQNQLELIPHNKQF